MIGAASLLQCERPLRRIVQVRPRARSALVLLLALGGPALHAQQLRLLVREAAGRTPVVGAIVRLMSPDGVIAQALTGATGRVTLSVPAGGRYRLRIDRIGYQGVDLAAVEIPPTGVLAHEVLIPSERLELPVVVVQGETQCAAIAGGGLPVTAIWGEIRKALEATVLTREQGETPLHIRNFTRETDLAGVEERRWYTRSAVERGLPFTAPPIEELLATGFVVMSGATATLHGPDAELLVSDLFVEGHCYAVVEGDSGRVGLVFQPVPNQVRPDIRGTLWIDRATSALTSMDFTYTAAPAELVAPLLGGELRFAQLPDGGWIIADWYIRAPRPGVRGRDGGDRFAGYLDRGGTVAVAPDEGVGSEWAQLSGSVHDSLSGHGLPGAIIAIPATGDSIVTDSDGRFSLVVRGAGDHLVTVSHPRLGLLGELTERTVMLSIGESAEVGFAVPSIETFVADRCGANRRNPAVVGLALAGSDIPAADLAIQFWTGPLGGRTTMRSARVAVSRLYAACDLPAGQSVTIRLYRHSSPLVEAVVILKVGEHRWVDLTPEGRGGPSSPE